MSAVSCVLIGNQSLLVQCAEMALDRGAAVVAVVTHNAQVRAWADRRGLPVEAPGRDLAHRLAGLSFDWLLSIANLSIIPEDVLALPARGAVNFHDGPLPRHAGLNAPVWALIEGETRHGIAWHLIEDAADTGDVLVTRSFAITDLDTGLTLNSKAYEAAIDSFPELYDQLATGRLQRQPQDPAARSYHARIDRPAGHGLLDFARPAAELERLVRALDHGGYWNPLAIPKFAQGGAIWLVGAAWLTEGAAAPGTLLHVDDETATVACGSGALRLCRLRWPDGRRADPHRLGAPGDRLDLPGPAAIEALTARKRQIAGNLPFWRRRLADPRPLALEDVLPGAGPVVARPVRLGAEPAAQAAAWACRLGGGAPADIAWRDATRADLAQGGFISGWVPLRIAPEPTLAAFGRAFRERRAAVAAQGSFAIDLPLRDPALAPLQVPHIALSDGAGPVPGAAITVEFGDSPRLHVDTGRVPAPLAELLAARLDALAGVAPDAPLAELPAMPPPEREAVIEKWNRTDAAPDPAGTIHRAFEAQAARSPDATALIAGSSRLGYAELDRRANAAARRLRAMGVRPGAVVGLCVRRGPALLVGALAILKAGGAYLPMDPTYPPDRLAHMLTDSGARVVVTEARSRDDLPSHDAALLLLAPDGAIPAAPAADHDAPDAPRAPAGMPAPAAPAADRDTPSAPPADRDTRAAAAPAPAADHRASDAPPAGGDSPAAPDAGPEDLAYVIYTSGSTGTPKGVMVEHRQVMNFFAGMDAHIPHDAGGTWLAVTSLSFDISVLELFWTTARGFTVVLADDEALRTPSNGPLPGRDGMAFSLYYWGNDDGAGRDKYRLLLEGARFADDNGFAAVWTPERHFHAFGGPYPNPSVTGAAIAGITRNIAVRGGSVVAPLHHPARIAEEWAVIDNLTNGRAGIAIASGWQPDDFVLRPENAPPANKTAMVEAIDTVRRLWRGEAVPFPRADGTMHDVVTQPRPVSRDLPVWVTTAGNPETWQEAGRQGCHVLTHLLGQSIDEVGTKIALYHAALREAGHDPAAFTVTLMLHSYLAGSRDAARETARGPMKAYLRSAAGLIKQYAWAFPAFKRPAGARTPFDLTLDGLGEDEMEAILDFAFERYFTDSGLFGTVEDAIARVRQVQAIGVTEIACLIDYGIDRDTVLAGLAPLAEVLRATGGGGRIAAEDRSIAAEILRHGVTHLQCTPSTARLLLADDGARAALAAVDHLFLGGEALPGRLVADLARATGATVTNFYGPTETTIWSSASRAVPGEGTVDIGYPIANTQLYVLDADRQPCPVGIEGELWIGGAGVARGYWNRPDLTAERFVPNPFHAGRMYRTGDLARRRADGRIDFLGRADHQVKLRGYRIELGEIEAALEALPGVTQAVVVARGDDTDTPRLVGYVTGAGGDDEGALRTALRARLPDFMVPARVVRLQALPLTPNRKIDRGALPAPETLVAAVPPAAAAPGVATPVQAAPAPSPAAAAASLSEPAAPPLESPDAVPPVAAGPAARQAPRRDGDAGEQADPRAMRDGLAALWSEILGVSRIGPRDSFFDLGGHSLLAVQAHRALRDRFGVQGLSITDIFRFPTLEALADRLIALGVPGLPEQPGPRETAGPVPASAPTVPADADQPGTGTPPHAITQADAAPPVLQGSEPGTAPDLREAMPLAPPAPASASGIPANARAQSRAEAMARRRRMRADRRQA